ncbi:MAG: M4 family metallopeptidase [Saprospiraceae bacterium]
MKLRSLLYLGLFLFCLPLQIFGQNTSLSNASLVKTFTFYKNTDPSLNHQNYFDVMSEKMHISESSKMVLTETNTDQNGNKHFKFQQFHEGLPIFGSRYILHETDGKVMLATGHFTPQTNISAKPGINAPTAISFAKRTMNAIEYDPRAVEPLLCFIDPAFPKVSENLRLAYQVDLYSTKPADRRRYFVDAISGKILLNLPLILQEGVPSKAKTRYYGTQNIITDSLGPQEFVLRDPTRGEGIFIYNDNGSNFTNTSSTWDLTNPQKDEVALDAHYCTQEYYDMMLADYNWQGVDGNGKALKVIVHIGDFANAFWDGESASFADGDCNYGPLTTLEVVGHEFTHGMIDYTSKLIYSGESGAINESLADMFGKMLERKADPANFSWDLGHSFLLSPTAEPFRVMDDPNSVEMPAYYKGLFWEDFNGVHTNSSIGNLWFSMLVDGKQGINEVGTAFNVPALGIDKAGQIVFQANQNFLIENSNYNDFYLYTVAVAEASFGAGSTEALAVKEAWKAVGLPGVLSTVLDLSIAGEGYFTENFCGLFGFIPITAKVTNLSSIAYTPSMMGSVTFSSPPFFDHVVPLTSPINPGEVFEIQVNDWLQAIEPGYKFVDLYLNLVDENEDNNTDYAAYSVSEFESDDLQLYAFLSPPKCFETTQAVSMYVSNNSCEPIPAGTSLSFTAADDLGNPFWASPPYFLDDEMIGGGSLFVSFDIPTTTVPLVFTLVYANDPDWLNNVFQDDSQESYLPITANYLNEFEINDGQDGYLELVAFFNLTLPYQNNNYFAATGSVEDPNDFHRCGDVLSVFNYDGSEGLNASIHTCIDFSFSPAPRLEFDLVQFRNNPSYQYGSMLQAKWTGNDSGDEIIFGQPEGMIQHHNFALPPFFKGELDLKFYTEIGHWGLDPSYLNQDDFVLLDNLKLSAPITGTTDPAAGSTIRIMPNPAKEMTSIQSSEGIKTILLQNVNGQTLQSLQVNAANYDLDIKGLANGFYLLNIQLENGQWALRKLVKMD